MRDKHWAVYALRDIQNALDTDRYEVASDHIGYAIASILARDDAEAGAFGARDSSYDMRPPIDAKAIC